MATGGSNIPGMGPKRTTAVQIPVKPPLDQAASARMGPRDVAIHPSTGVPLEDTAGQHPPYIPIHKRDVVIEEVKGGLWGSILSGLSKAVMVLVKAGAGASGNEFDNKLKKDKQFVKENTKRLKAYQAEMSSIRAELNSMRRKLSRLKPDQQHRFSELHKRLFELREELSTLEHSFRMVGEMDPFLKASDEAIKREMKEGMQSMEKNMNPGLRLLVGLQKVFKESKQGLPKGKVYQLNLGDVSTKTPSGAELNAQNISVFIEQCYMSPTGELTLDIADIRADLSSFGENGEVEPMTLSGGISIKLRRPASDHFLKAMTSSTLTMPKHIYNLGKELKPVFKGMFKDPPESRLSDVAEVSIKGLQLERDGQSLPLQEAPFAHSLLDLMIPVMGGSQELPPSSLELEGRRNHRELKLAHENLVRQEQELKEDVDRFLEDIKSLPEGDSRDRCKRIGNKASRELEALTEDREAKGRQLTFSRQSRKVQKKRLKDIQASLEMSRGMIDLVYGLVTVANANSADSQTHLDIPRMMIPVSGASSVELSQLKINLSDFSFSEGGVVELNIPEMASHITLQNEATGEKRSVPVILRGASIKIHPPYGVLAKELLQLKFPLDSKAVEEVVLPIYKEMDRKRSDGGPKTSDYAEVDLGKVSCLTQNGEVTFSGERGSHYQERRQEFVKKTGDLLSTDIDAKSMAKALESVGLTRETQQKIWKLSEEGVFAESVVFAPEKLENMVLLSSLEEPVDEAAEGAPDEGYISSTPLDSLVEHHSVSLTPELPENEVLLKTAVPSTVPEPESPEIASVDSPDSNPDSLPQEVLGSSVSAPEQLQSTTVNSQITDSVVPSTPPIPELENRDSVPEIDSTVQALKADRLTAPKENSLTERAIEVEVPETVEAPVKKALSKPVVQPPSEQPQEGLKFKDLKECLGVFNPKFRAENGKRTADFEMRIAPQGLMKKLSWWMSLFFGKEEVAVQVVLPIDRKSSGLQLQSPAIQLKKQTSYNPAVWLATFVLNRRLRKLQYQLELDHVEQQKRLSLAHRPLISPA
ncbi:hypothetical protein [Endozoicomonas arenosclerae]|uniref:hypothetical protein n=1 Tax=Endozoicomonas arenosclerae TaxID=1633495 RepID=UPI0007823803|nr:hypothetical protein [Endozoicomonas arenosclerae]